jgi:hypothetical protein
VINLFCSRKTLLLCLVSQSDKKRHVKANGLLAAAKRTSERGAEINWMQSYERRMRIFNLEVILAALIALAIFIVWLFTAWGAFQNSVLLVRPMSSLPQRVRKPVLGEMLDLRLVPNPRTAAFVLAAVL